MTTRTSAAGRAWARRAGAVVALAAAALAGACGPRAEERAAAEGGLGPSSGVAAAGTVARDESGREVDLRGLPEPVRRMVEARLARARAGGEVPATCFAPDTPEEVVRAFNARIFPEFEDQNDFQPVNRWTNPASGGAPTGSPVTVTWSIVPDGTPISGFNGEPAAASNLRAFLTGIYGSEAAWLAVMQRVTARWSQVSGIRYVYEPSDDGAALGTTGGQLGVRGDVRIGGHPIDGAGSVLAYNFYPDNGDMVIDTGDTFFSTTGNDSLRLRNVMAHEMGHGLGMAHVCPLESTKLMEPAVSESFDGPRHDDIRHAHALYGDAMGDNHSVAKATSLGALSACEARTVGDVPNPAGFFGTLFYGSLLSIGSAGEQDYFSFTLDSPRRLTAILTPVGIPYDDSPQVSGSCTSGNVIDTLPGAELSLAVLGGDGAAVLAQTPASGAGVDKSVSGVLLGAGTYYLRVSAVSVTARVPQLYTINLAAPAGGLDVAVLGGAERAVAPGDPARIDVSIAAAGDVPAAGARVEYRLNGGAVQTAGLTGLGGSAYRAEIPALSCGDRLTFRVVAPRAGGADVTLPCSGEFAPYTGALVTAFSDDMETDRGWVAGPDTASSGSWVRGDPTGTAAQPEYDHTPGAGTQCWFTGDAARGLAPGTADVDGGEVRLVSPVINLSGYADATVEYWRWFSNGFGAGPYNDRFRVQVSTNNATWTTVQTIGPGSGTNPDVNGLWRFGTFNLSDAGIVPTATVRLRFIVEDISAGSLTEGAIDDVAVIGRTCVPPVSAGCPADYNGDGFGNLDDLGDFITDFYTNPAIAGGAQAGAPTYAGLAVGYGRACPTAGDAPLPYAADAYRVSGYRVGFSPDGGNACPVGPGAPFPNLDNLGDFVTFYYESVGVGACR